MNPYIGGTKANPISYSLYSYFFIYIVFSIKTRDSKELI